MEVRTVVEVGHEELVKIVSDFVLEKIGRPQGSVKVEFDTNNSRETNCVVTINGNAPGRK